MTLAVRWAIGSKPPPFVNFQAGYGVVWAAKSASTTVLLWHLAQLDRLSAAARHHRWPHRYRHDVLQLTPEYVNWLRAGNPRSLKWYWIVRDPVKRALSSFRHLMKQPAFDLRLSELLGRDISSAAGYSLDDFMTYLELVNVESPCNIHLRSQWHPILDHCEFKIINADRSDLGEGLNAIAAKHDLAKIDFESFEELSRLAATHYSRETAESVPVASSTIFNRSDAKVHWPLRDATLGAAARSRLSAIYALDIKRIYGSGCSDRT